MQDSVINGRYKVIRELGQGGMGCVYLVEDQHRKNQRLALKTLLLGDADPRTIDRFSIELLGLARLRHPNIASAYDLGQIGGTSNYFFTTEFVDGVDLFRATLTASTRQIVDLFAQTLRGLELIHSSGFLHNDLKPGNILVELAPKPARKPARPAPGSALMGAELPIGRVKIIDFGLFAAEKACWENLLGTPQFLSPERIRGQTTDRRSDLYSLGMIFYLLFARTLPFNSRDSDAILAMHLDTQPPSLSFFRPDMPIELVTLIEKLLRKDPSDRFQSAAETLAHLEEVSQRGLGAPDGPRSPQLAAGELFGRISELIALEESFCTASAAMTDAPCIVLRGPSGIGKTRLVRELSGLVQVSRGAYIEISGREPGVTSMHVAEVILRGLETCGVKDLDVVREALAELPVDSKEVGRTIEEAVLRNSHGIPILLHFDDFQRSPAAIRGLALGIVRTAREHLTSGTAKPRLLVVLSCSRDGRRVDLSGLDDFPTIDLKPLAKEEARAFLRRLFGQEDFPEETLDAIVSCAAGAPGRLVELASDLVDREVVQRTGSKWIFPVTW